MNEYHYHFEKSKNLVGIKNNSYTRILLDQKINEKLFVN